MDEVSSRIDLRSLVDQHYELVYRYAYHLSGSAADAEDLTQEAFCTAQAKLGQLRDLARARGWLCKILRNHYLRSLRAGRVVSVASLDGLADEPEAFEGSDADWATGQLHEVLREMPESYRTPIILFYFQEFSYRQIADQMGVPIGTVMSRLARGKTYLRWRLRPDHSMSRLNSFTPGVT